MSPNPLEPATEESLAREMRRRAASHVEASTRRLFSAVGQAVEPRAWLRRYPLASAGAAAVIGLMAVGTVFRSPRPDGAPRGRLPRWLAACATAAQFALTTSRKMMVTALFARVLRSFNARPDSIPPSSSQV